MWLALLILLLSSVAHASQRDYEARLSHIFDPQWSDDEESSFPYRWQDVLELEHGYGLRLLPNLNFKLASVIFSLLEYIKHPSQRAQWNHWGCSGLDSAQVLDLLRAVPKWHYHLVFGKECRRNLPIVFWSLLDVEAAKQLPTLRLEEVPQEARLSRKVHDWLAMRDHWLDAYSTE